MKRVQGIHEIVPDGEVSSTNVTWKRLACCALLALGSSSAAFAGTLPADESDESESAPQASEGLLPVPDYSGDWWTRPALSGDWGGARQDLANKGFTFGVDWLQVGQGIVSGGLKEHWTYASNFDYRMNFDLMRMGLLPGALVTFRAQSRFGSTINADTGQLLPANSYQIFPLTDPIDEDVPFAITELNYVQYLSEEVGVLLGKVTTMGSSNEFAGGEGRSQFMNFQFIFASPLATIGPYSTLAAGAFFTPSPNVSTSLMVLNTKDSSTTSGFDDFDDGQTWAATIDTKYEMGDLPGGVSFLGAYAMNGDFNRLGGIYIDGGNNIAFDQKSTNWALYLNSWQYFYTEKEAPGTAVDGTDGRQDLQGLGGFLMLGTADQDVNPTAWSIAGGLSGRGSIHGRDDDTWGLGYFYNDLQEPSSTVFSGLGNTSQGIEGYYNIAVAQAAAFTLDAQWLKSAFPDVEDSVVLGARLNLSF